MIYLINNILYISDPEDYAVVAKDKGLGTALETVAGKIPKKDSRAKDFVTLCEKLLADSKSNQSILCGNDLSYPAFLKLQKKI